MNSEGIKTEMGVIPKAWKLEKLGNFLTHKKGFAFKSKWFKENGHPVVKVKDLTGNSIDMSDCVFLDKKKVTEFNDVKIDEGDVLIATVGSWPNNPDSVVGKVVKVPKRASGALLNQNTVRLRAKKDFMDQSYLFYRLKNRDFSNYLVSGAQGSANQASITLNDIFSFEMYLPPIKEQKIIANFFADIDDKIHLNQEMNQTLEAIGQAIFRHWFVHFEFPDENGQPYKTSGGEMVDSELGEIPKGWKVGKLGDIIINFDKIRIPLSKKERESRKGQYPYYGATSIMDYIDDFLFDDVYVLMAEDGSVIDNEERPVLQYVWGKFWVNNHAHVLKGKKGIPDEFIYLLLKNSNIRHLITGAVQLKINQKNMNSLEIIIPDFDTLSKFSDIIKPIFTKYRTYSDENETLSEIRDSLLPKLMSGKIRVPKEATGK